MYEIINNVHLKVKEYKGQRVVTFKDIDTVHGRPEGTAKRNFSKNREYFIEGEDYFKVCGDEIRTDKLMDISQKTHGDIILITESGYLMIVKSLTDKLSWSVQREIVKTYFRARQAEVLYNDAVLKILENQEEIKRRIIMYRLLSNPIEQNGQRVLTTAQLAEAYGTDSRIISNNFNRNINRYKEGEHFYRLTGDELKEFKACHQIDDNLKFAPFILLWTERGSLLHAKSLNTDKAWEAYDYLIEHYFRSTEMMVYYNNAIMKILEKQEQKLDKLEKEISYIRNDVLDIRRSEMIISDKFEDAKQFINNTLEKAIRETVKVLAPFMQLPKSISGKNKTKHQPRGYSNGKIENLPPAIKNKVDEMIISGRYSCQKITDFIIGITGESISYMTVSRYIRKYFSK